MKSAKMASRCTGKSTTKSWKVHSTKAKVCENIGGKELSNSNAISDLRIMEIRLKQIQRFRPFIVVIAIFAVVKSILYFAKYYRYR